MMLQPPPKVKQPSFANSRNSWMGFLLLFVKSPSKCKCAGQKAFRTRIEYHVADGFSSFLRSVVFFGENGEKGEARRGNPHPLWNSDDKASPKESRLAGNDIHSDSAKHGIEALDACGSGGYEHLPPGGQHIHAVALEGGLITSDFCLTFIRKTLYYR